MFSLKWLWFLASLWRSKTHCRPARLLDTPLGRSFISRFLYISGMGLVRWVYGIFNRSTRLKIILEQYWESSAITQCRFLTCNKVWPSLVSSAICSLLVYVGVIKNIAGWSWVSFEFGLLWSFNLTLHTEIHSKCRGGYIGGVLTFLCLLSFSLIHSQRWIPWWFS